MWTLCLLTLAAGIGAFVFVYRPGAADAGAIAWGYARQAAGAIWFPALAGISVVCAVAAAVSAAVAARRPLPGIARRERDREPLSIEPTGVEDGRLVSVHDGPFEAQDRYEEKRLAAIAAGQAPRGGLRVPLAPRLHVLAAAFALGAVVAFFVTAFHDAAVPKKRWFIPGYTPDRSFRLTIDTKPPGAEVVIDGQPRGRSPVMVNVPCAKAGDPVKLHVEQPGFRVWEDVLPCQRDVTVRRSITMEGVP